MQIHDELLSSLVYKLVKHLREVSGEDGHWKKKKSGEEKYKCGKLQPMRQDTTHQLEVSVRGPSQKQRFHPLHVRHPSAT